MTLHTGFSASNMRSTYSSSLASYHHYHLDYFRFYPAHISWTITPATTTRANSNALASCTTTLPIFTPMRVSPAASTTMRRYEWRLGVSYPLNAQHYRAQPAFPRRALPPVGTPRPLIIPIPKTILRRPTASTTAVLRSSRSPWDGLTQPPRS